MKALIINIFALFLILNLPSKLFSQEIEIDLTFTSDTVIFPFEYIDTISELNMEGELSLHSDTSLVRVILEDDSGVQYMILEAYPLICPDTNFSISHHHLTSSNRHYWPAFAHFTVIWRPTAF